MEGRQHRILVPSAGGPGCVNLTRGLRRIPGVVTVGCDASPHYLFGAETDVRYLISRRDDEKRWMSDILRLVDREKVDFIFPNNSLDGVLLARMGPSYGLPLFLPAADTFTLGENKWESYRCFQRAELPVPRTRLLNGPADVEAGFEEFGADVVWVRGAGIPGKGIGVASLPARSVHQAVSWVEYWSGWGQMTLSEYLPGGNLTWMGLFQHGQLVCSQSRQRDAYVIPHVSPSGITGAPAISHTVHRDDLNRLGLAACLAIDPGFHGPAFVDFKESAQGIPCITEINVGRFGTTHHFYTEAGANFPELVVRLFFGEILPEWVSSYDVLPEGLYWIRTLDVGPVLVTQSQLDDLKLHGCIEGGRGKG